MATVEQVAVPEAAPAPAVAAEPSAHPESSPTTNDVALALALAREEDASAFECNICLELSKEPVVTLCGHLFCWPCLYRSASVGAGAQAPCRERGGDSELGQRLHAGRMPSGAE
jgi:hypothetical protein